MLSVVPISVKAQKPLLSVWGFRSEFIVNPAAGAGANYDVMVTADYGYASNEGNTLYVNGSSRPDFGDVRFTAGDGTTLLNYWMENYVSGANATFWVQVPEDLSASRQELYMYYGNPATSSLSDGSATFPFFDDFHSGLTSWAGNTSYAAVSGGLALTSPAQGNSTLYTTTTFQAGTAIRIKLQYADPEAA